MQNISEDRYIGLYSKRRKILKHNDGQYDTCKYYYSVIPFFSTLITYHIRYFKWKTWNYNQIVIYQIEMNNFHKKISKSVYLSCCWKIKCRYIIVHIISSNQNLYTCIHKYKYEFHNVVTLCKHWSAIRIIYMYVWTVIFVPVLGHIISYHIISYHIISYQVKLINIWILHANFHVYYITVSVEISNSHMWDSRWLKKLPAAFTSWLLIVSGFSVHWQK